MFKKQLVKFKARQRQFLKDERGDMSVKGIAATVAVIVIIGIIITVINTELKTWIPEVWEMFMQKIKEFTGNS